MTLTDKEKTKNNAEHGEGA